MIRTDGVSCPSGPVYWTQVLVLSECVFESRPGRPVAALMSLSKTPNHNLLRKAVGPVCYVMHVKEPCTLIVKEKGLALEFLAVALLLLLGSKFQEGTRGCTTFSLESLGKLVPSIMDVSAEINQLTTLGKDCGLEGK